MLTRCEPLRVAGSVNDRGSFARRGSLLLVLLALVALGGCTSEPAPEPLPDVDAPAMTSGVVDRAVPPSVGGVRLDLLESGSRPPQPVQWASASEPVPFGQWWSGLANGPGLPALWAQPLLLRMNDEGRVDLSTPTRSTRDDGFRDADVVPAIFFEFGPDATVTVIDEGPLHVRFVVTAADAELTITMVQGSPFLELEGSGSVTMTVPALNGLGSTTLERFSTAAGPWLLASSEAPGLNVDGDRVVLELADGVRHALGPAAEGDQAAYDEAALAVASHPLIDSVETLTVGADGSVRQVLQQQRDDDAGSAWSLLPHHIDLLAGDPAPAGLLSSTFGTSPIVLATELIIEYPSVPVVWGAVAPTDFDVDSMTLDDLPQMTVGSYFGGKYTATNAMVHDVLQAAGADAASERFLDTTRTALASLVTPDVEPRLVWEPGWGSIIITPAEFGADVELNDHQLQNGYWVGAAASVVVADPTQRTLLIDAIDLLVADYAGAGVVPHLDGVVSDQGTWSAFAGHSWASGIGGFAAGNNLESVSESSYAWWAAAKWFLATDRPELADAFVARLTIESWLTGYEWLPTNDNQSDDPAVRPWSGVVWAGKADPGTWFDASDEAALGIRLLPIGPQSFSRYPDADAIEAAETRWAWCETNGFGCIERWWNLLDSDAAVAGLATLPVGQLPEESTTEVVRHWWRSHWETSSMADGWTCAPGTTMRVDDQGFLIALVSNPSSVPTTVVCANGNADLFEVVAEPRSTTIVPLNRS